MKSLFEQMGGIYTMQRDYDLPDLRIPTEDKHPLGVWGQRRGRFLKKYHKILYYDLLTSGKLHTHLADIEEQAQRMFLRLVEQYAQREGITEQLKAEDPMAWVQRVNNIRARASECVN